MSENGNERPRANEEERIGRLRRAIYSREMSPKIHERDRREMEPTELLVGEDWRRQEDSVSPVLAAPSRIKFMRYFLWWVLAASALFFVSTLVFFSYYFFIGPGSVTASPGNIDIAIAGPPQVAGGQASELQIVITNRNRVPLQAAELVVNFPKGTRSPTDFVTDEPSLRQPLGTIEPGGQRQGTVKAVFVGKESDRAEVKVEVEYRLQGSSAIYVSSQPYTLTFSSSPIVVSLEGNTQTVSGQPVQITAIVQSNTSAPVKDVVMKAEYPFGFKFTSASPAPSVNGFWELGDLAPGAKRSVVIMGTLSGESADERVFNFTAGTRKAPEIKQVDTPFSNTPFRMTIAQPFLSLDVEVNKATGPNVNVVPGENISVAIFWENNLSTAITDAVIVARLNGVPIDGSGVRTTDGFYRSADNTIIWDKKTSGGELAALAPGDRGVVGFTFQMPPSSEISGARDPYLEIVVNASGNRVSETGVPQNLQSTSRQRIAIASELQLVAQGLYYQSPFGSVGPMPPKANAETTYAIVFTINNTTSKIASTTLKATLPPYVRFAGHTSPKEEDVTFNQNDNSMVWNINSIEPGVGLGDKPPRQMAVEIGLTPSASQIGSEPPLIQNIILNGFDTAAKEKVSIKLPDVTTNLAQPSKSSRDIIIGTDKGFTSANAGVVK